MLKNIFLIFILFICVNNVSGEILTDIEIQSPLFTNTIDENKYPIHILQNEEVNSSKSLGDNLKGLSGITNADYGLAVGQPSIRGLTGNRTKILLNGIVVNDLSSLSADHINNVDLNNISHIEVLKGSSSIFSYGGTSGGIINIISDIVSEEKYNEDILKFDYNSVNNGYGHNFLVKRNMFNTNLFFSINNKHLDNYSLPEGSLFDEGVEKRTLANSDYKSQNINLGISFPRQWGYFGLAFENNDGVYGIPFHAEEEEEEEEEEEHRIFTKVETETYIFKGKYNNSRYFNSVDYSYRDSNSFLKEHEEDGSAFLDSNSKALSLKFNLDDEFYEKRLLLQYDHTKSPMKTAYIPSSVSYDRSVSYFIRTKNKPYEIDFAGRYESNSRDSLNQRYGDTSISFGTSLSHKFGKSFFYNIGYAHISRSPSISELFANGSHAPTQRYERGNNNMSREISRNIELGLQYSFSEIDMNLNLYRNDINNFIFLQDQSTSTGGKTDAIWSQKNAIMQGYEISASRLYNFDAGDLLIKLSRDDISGIFNDDTYIPRITPARNILSLKYENQKNDMYYLDFIYTESQGDMSSIETKTNSHIDLDLGYSKKIIFDSHRSFIIDMYGNNILNKTIRNHSSFVKDNVPTAGANFGINMSLKYKF